MLDIVGLTTGYGDIPVVHGIDVQVPAGELVALLGPNGAGKTTTMLAIAGVLPSTGDINFEDRPLTGPLHRRVRRGLGFIPEERAVFRQLSTRINLGLGAGGVDGALELFPELERLLDRQAGLLSGGEQQMLVLARALAAKPRLLLVDELSLGLAPMIVNGSSPPYARPPTAAPRFSSWNNTPNKPSGSPTALTCYFAAPSNSREPARRCWRRSGRSNGAIWGERHE